MENVLCERKDKTEIITLNKPESYNSFDMELAECFFDKLNKSISSSDVKSIIITGAGNAFCAGGNIKKMVEGPDSPSEMLGKLIRVLNMSITEIKRSKKPVIAAINGIAAGAGFSIAMACDLKVADKNAKFKQAYTSSGLVPDGGWTIFVPALAGYSRAMELALLDDVILADKALEWGLINKTCPKEKIMDISMEWAEKINNGPAFAFSEVKRLINNNTYKGLESALENERNAMIEVSAHPDGIEGISAFIEKRVPKFGK